jgi:Chaperone of endosialidase
MAFNVIHNPVTFLSGNLALSNATANVLNVTTINATSYLTSAGLDVTGQANSAYGQANLAYAAANASVQNSGGTITGSLNVNSNLVVGNLYVIGSTTNVNTTSLIIDSNTILLAANQTSPMVNAYISVERGGAINTSLIWNETTGQWGYSEAANGAFVSFDSIKTTANTGNNTAALAYSAANVALNTAFSSVSTSGNNYLLGVGATATNALMNANSSIYFSGTTLYAATLNLTNALGTGYGGTGLTSFTANGVVYASSTSALATGSALTFDGTTLLSSSFTTANGVNGAYKLGYNSSTSSRSWKIVNDVNVYGDFNILQSTTQAGTTYQGVYSALNDGTQFWLVGGSEQMRLTSTGLGIGTSSPAVKLDVYNSASSGISEIARFRWNNGGSGGAITLANQAGTVLGQIANISDSNGNPLSFYVYNNSTALTKMMTLDGSGNLGLGGTPSAYVSFKAVDVGLGSGLIGLGSSYPDTQMLTNAYYGSGGWTYKTTGTALSYEQNGYYGSGQHKWYIAPSGTAGNAISFTQAMTLDNSGNLGIGTTSPVFGLHVQQSVSNASTYNGGAVATFFNSYDNYTANGSTAYPVLRLVRGGSTGNTYSSIADLAISRWNTSGTYAYTQLNFNLSNGNVGSPDTTVMSLLSSGNVGIGITSPQYKLHVAGSTTYSTTDDAATVLKVASTTSQYPTFPGEATAIAITKTGEKYGWRMLSQYVADTYSGMDFHLQVSADSTPSWATKMFVEGLTGNVGIGTTSPGYLLDVAGNIRSTTNINLSGSFNASFIYMPSAYSGSGGNPQYIANWASPSAGWGIGPDTGSNDNMVRLGQTTVGSTAAWNGTYCNLKILALTQTSDYRIKQNVVNYPDGALQKILALRPVTFNFNNDDRKLVGFIAHEVQEQIPEIVRGTKDQVDAQGDPVIQSVDYPYMVAVLTKAIQEQQAIIEQLKAKVGL